MTRAKISAKLLLLKQNLGLSGVALAQRRGGTPVDVVAAEAVGAPEAAGDASNRELTEVLEKEHAANPTYLARPGRIKRFNDAGELADADQPEGPGVGGNATEQQEEEAAQEDVQPQQPPPMSRAAKRARQDHMRALIQQAIGTIQATEAGRQRRHEERLAARRQAAEDKRCALNAEVKRNRLYSCSGIPSMSAVSVSRCLSSRCAQSTSFWSPTVSPTNPSPTCAM
ncbi:uncharacterized protein LOC144159200 isoform X2 [Haemaphysalis longicornis]